MINVTELNGLEEVSNRLISQKNTCVRSNILMNPRVTWKGYRRVLFLCLTRFSGKRERGNERTGDYDLNNGGLLARWDSASSSLGLRWTLELGRSPPSTMMEPPTGAVTPTLGKTTPSTVATSLARTLETSPLAASKPPWWWEGSSLELPPDWVNLQRQHSTFARAHKTLPKIRNYEGRKRFKMHTWKKKWMIEEKIWLEKQVFGKRRKYKSKEWERKNCLTFLWSSRSF